MNKCSLDLIHRSLVVLGQNRRACAVVLSLFIFGPEPQAAFILLTFDFRPNPKAAGFHSKPFRSLLVRRQNRRPQAVVPSHFAGSFTFLAKVIVFCGRYFLALLSKNTEESRT